MAVALISRNTKSCGRWEFRFLEKNYVIGIRRKKVSELQATGTHSVCVPLKDLELFVGR